MNKSLLILVLIAIVVNNSKASTNVSGQIRNNTTWTKAGSPYIMGGNMEVAPGVTLIIEPGVEVRGCYSCTLDVFGKVQAIGTETDSIVFTANPGIAWYGIVLRKSINDTNVFKYCIFDGITKALESYSASLEVSKSFFKEVAQSITVHSDNANPFFALIYNNTIMRTIQAGGALICSGFGSLLFKNNKVINSTFSCYVTCDQFMEISENEFYKIGIGLCFGTSNKSAIVRNNIITGANTGVGMILRGTIFDNAVSGNIISGCRYGMEIWDVYGEISGNTIYQNEIGVQSSHTVDKLNGYEYLFRNNCIEKNKSYGYLLLGPTAMNIQGNWWGVTDSLSVDTAVKDYSDDFRLPVLQYMPVLQNKDSGCRTITPPAAAIKEMTTLSREAQVYPNPFSYSLCIQSSKGADVKEISLYNLVGERVAYNHTITGNMVKVNTAHLPQGIYIYKVIYSDGISETGKVTRQ